MPTPTTWLADNQAVWDALVGFHVRSDFYDVRGFLGGVCTLRPPELDAVGDVQGRSLLHLQCHFGLDTLSWARRGARATGLDFSPAAIRAARMLNERLDLGATFVQAEVTQAAEALGGATFDVVVSTWGVLMWLPDLAAWARAVAACLAPGGRFVLVEVHPTTWQDDAFETAAPGTPLTMPAEGSYAAPHADLGPATQHLFQHDLDDVIAALTEAGLRIERLVEHPFTDSPVLPGMVQRPDGMWETAEGAESPPLSFTLVATAS